jgi:hypothetical protein
MDLLNDFILHLHDEMEHAKYRRFTLCRVLLAHLGEKGQRAHKENKVHAGPKESLDHLTSYCCLWQIYGTASDTYRTRCLVVMGKTVFNYR